MHRGQRWGKNPGAGRSRRRRHGYPNRENGPLHRPGGLHPENFPPILLDVGTDNEERLKDPIYIGWRHNRVRGGEYDAFVDAFVKSVRKRWPHVLLQWEDFA